MKTRIKELATTVPGIFFIVLACVCYVLGLMGKMNFTFWMMLLPLSLGLFLILSSYAAIKVFIGKVLGKIVGVVLLFILVTSCSLETRMIKSPDTCMLCDKMCEVHDSVYIENTKEIIKYDTIIQYILDDNWIISEAPISDTVYIKSEIAESFSYVDDGKLKIALRNNKKLEQTITLYKEKITEKTEKFEKTQALKNDYDELQKDLIKALRIRSLLIITTIFFLLTSILIFKLK